MAHLETAAVCWFGRGLPAALVFGLARRSRSPLFLRSASWVWRVPSGFRGIGWETGIPLGWRGLRRAARRHYSVLWSSFFRIFPPPGLKRFIPCLPQRGSVADY